MKRVLPLLAIFLIVALLAGVGCGEKRGQDYRQAEAVAAVHAYLLGLAKSPEATNYVHALINDWNWGAEYNATQQSWRVSRYKTGESGSMAGVRIEVGSWYVYRADMSLIDSSESMAASFKAEIERLNQGH